MYQKIRELRSIIFLKFDSESDCAEALGWTRQRLNKITNGIKEPDIGELNDLSITLDTSVESLAQIFLRAKSPSRQLSSA